MTRDLSLAQLRRLRLRNHQLADASRGASAAVVQRLCALQSQEWRSAQLAIAARTTGLTQEDLRRAREVERSFLLTWNLRGTLHLVAAEDIAWQLALCAERAISATRRRYQQLGLSENVREKALNHIAEILAKHGPLTRAQFAEKLEPRGIPVAGQAIHHLLRFAALRGLVCFGPEVAGNLTYVLLNDWLPDDQAQKATDAPTEETLTNFARRYLRAYGPAASADFARWSGLSAAQVKAAWQAIAAECLTVATPSGEAQMLKRQLDLLASPPSRASARLLPRYDNYLLGYESRDFMVKEAYAKRVHPGGGLLRACVIINGEAAANWKLEKRRNGIRILVQPFAALDRAIMPLLDAEAQSLGCFFNTNAELRLESP